MSEYTVCDWIKINDDTVFVRMTFDPKDEASLRTYVNGVENGRKVHFTKTKDVEK